MAVLILVVSSCLALAQESNPVLLAVSTLGKTGVKYVADFKDSPTAFKPTGKHRFVEETLATTFNNAGERELMRPQFLAMLDAYEAMADEQGIPIDDVCGPLAMSVAMMLYTKTSDEAEPGAILSLVENLQAALDVPSVRGATDDEKQYAYDRFALMMMSLAFSLNPNAPASLRQAIDDNIDKSFKLTFGTIADAFVMSGDTITILSPKELREKIVAPGFKYKLPAGWTESGPHFESTKKLTYEGQKVSVTVRVEFLKAELPKGNKNQTLQKLCSDLDAGDYLYGFGQTPLLRRVGNGLATTYVLGLGVDPVSGLVSLNTLYLVDCKTHLQPVLIQQLYDIPDEIEDFYEIMRFLAEPGYVFQEEYLAGFAHEAAAGRPLTHAIALVGDYTFGDMFALDGGDVYSGLDASALPDYTGSLKLKEDWTFTWTKGPGQDSAKGPKEKGSGTWKVDGDYVLLNFRNMNGNPSVQTVKYRIAGAGTVNTDWKALVLAPDDGVKLNGTNLATKAIIMFDLPD